MVIGKIGGVTSSGYVRPIVRRLATDSLQRDVFVLRGTVVHVEASRRRFALRQEAHAYNVGWSAQTEFLGTDAASMQGLEICVKGTIQADVFQAESIVAVC